LRAGGEKSLGVVAVRFEVENDTIDAPSFMRRRRTILENV